MRPGTTWFLRQQLSCCQTPLRMLIPEEKTFVTVSFQASLNKLLETLGRAEPFFIRCIRSNAEKVRLSCLLRSRARALQSLYFNLFSITVCRGKLTKVWEEMCCPCDSSWAPQALTGCSCWCFTEGDALWWELGAAAVTVHGHAGNCADQEVWLQCQIHIPGTVGTASGLCFQEYLHILCVSSCEAHDHLGWAVRMHCSFERACTVKNQS